MCEQWRKERARDLLKRHPLSPPAYLCMNSAHSYKNSDAGICVSEKWTDKVCNGWVDVSLPSLGTTVTARVLDFCSSTKCNDVYLTLSAFSALAKGNKTILEKGRLPGPVVWKPRSEPCWACYAGECRTVLYSACADPQLKWRWGLWMCLSGQARTMAQSRGWRARARASQPSQPVSQVQRVRDWEKKGWLERACTSRRRRRRRCGTLERVCLSAA